MGRQVIRKKTRKKKVPKKKTAKKKVARKVRRTKATKIEEPEPEPESKSEPTEYLCRHCGEIQRKFAAHKDWGRCKNGHLTRFDDNLPPFKPPVK